MEQTPEHVERTPGGVSVCRHCCGEVGEDGYSVAMQDGDHEVETENEAQKEGDTGEMPQQSLDSFADALRRRGSR